MTFANENEYAEYIKSNIILSYILFKCTLKVDELMKLYFELSFELHFELYFEYILGMFNIIYVLAF